MNHNNVISLPISSGATLTMGTVVGINATGEAILPTGTTVSIGVVLHDAKETDSAAPVAVQLFSGGGICIIKAGLAHIIGAVISVHGTNGKTVANVGAANVPSFIVLEASGADLDLIRVIIK